MRNEHLRNLKNEFSFMIKYKRDDLTENEMSHCDKEFRRISRKYSDIFYKLWENNSWIKKYNLKLYREMSSTRIASNHTNLNNTKKFNSTYDKSKAKPLHKDDRMESPSQIDYQKLSPRENTNAVKNIHKQKIPDSKNNRNDKIVQDDRQIKNPGHDSRDNKKLNVQPERKRDFSTPSMRVENNLGNMVKMGNQNLPQTAPIQQPEPFKANIKFQGQFSEEHSSRHPIDMNHPASRAQYPQQMHPAYNQYSQFQYQYQPMYQQQPMTMNQQQPMVMNQQYYPPMYNYQQVPVPAQGVYPQAHGGTPTYSGFSPHMSEQRMSNEQMSDRTGNVNNQPRSEDKSMRTDMNQASAHQQHNSQRAMPQMHDFSESLGNKQQKQSSPAKRISQKMVSDQLQTPKEEKPKQREEMEELCFMDTFPSHLPQQDQVDNRPIKPQKSNLYEGAGSLEIIPEKSRTSKPSNKHYLKKKKVYDPAESIKKEKEQKRQVQTNQPPRSPDRGHSSAQAQNISRVNVPSIMSSRATPRTEQTTKRGSERAAGAGSANNFASMSKEQRLQKISQLLRKPK